MFQETETPKKVFMFQEMKTLKKLLIFYEVSLRTQKMKKKKKKKKKNNKKNFLFKKNEILNHKLKKILIYEEGTLNYQA